jgi:hypothetical protein
MTFGNRRSGGLNPIDGRARVAGGWNQLRLGRDVNPFEYLTRLQEHAEELAANPERWMPWNRGAPLRDKPNEQAR